MVPEDSMNNPLCHSAIGSMVTFDYVTPVTEAGGRVATNVLVRELDLVGVPAADARRLEVVVDGLPLHAGVQLAVDATLVGALRGDGSAKRGVAGCRPTEEGSAGIQSWTWCQITCVEFGGRWSAETSGFVGALARAKSRCAVLLMRKRLRWGSVLSKKEESRRRL